MRKRNFKWEHNLEPRANFIPALIGGAASLLGAGIGYAGQNSAANKAAARTEQALRELEGLPDYEYIQGISPLLEQQAADLQAAQIAEDPTLRSTELAALQNMQQLAKEGMSAADAYNYMKAQQQTGMESRGAQEAIIAEMQRKGAAGSGIEYALRSQASQSAVDRFAEQQAMQAAKNAEMRALANLQQQQMAGNIRGEDFRTNSANTNALNQFALENARNKEALQNRNIDRQNIYSAGETGERRRVQSGNVDLAGQRAAQRSNVQQGLATQDLARGVAGSNMTRDVTETIGKVGGAAWDYFSKPSTTGSNYGYPEIDLNLPTRLGGR